LRPRAGFWKFLTESSLIRRTSVTSLGDFPVVTFSILSVDDEKDVTDLVKFHLTRAGYHVVTAATGKEALDLVEVHTPDLILLDLMLPDIDGFGVCEILRRRNATATIPIVLLTAWATHDARHLGLELGALDYLTKPFSPKELVARVGKLLSLRHTPA
jgi:two-component system, OmpR family, alkaline phosphatase synthesis response regulator PhoP